MVCLVGNFDIIRNLTAFKNFWQPVTEQRNKCVNSLDSNLIDASGGINVKITIIDMPLKQRYVTLYMGYKSRHRK